MSSILEVTKLTKAYHGEKANNSISFNVNEGDILGIIGENGAGKTTLLKMICGHIKPTSGTIYVKDTIKIGGLIENPGLLPFLTADENLKAKQLLLGKVSLLERKLLLESVGLATDSDKKVKKYSLGMKQRLGIAMAGLGEANLLVLDEPTNGLDPTGMMEIRKFLVDTNEKDGKTIIISSHLLGELLKIATKFIFIKNGEMVYQCSKKDLPQGITLEDLYVKYVGGECIV